MQIDIEDLERFLPVFVPAIVTAAMITCEDAAIGRYPTKSEIEEISDVVKQAVRRYVIETRNRLIKKGVSFDGQDYLDMTEKMYQKIFDNAWSLIQLSVQEAESRLLNGEDVSWKIKKN